MALNRKYAALPDLDSAPDVYETPELTDDNSTIPTSANRPPSEDEFEDEDPDDADGISRSRLRVGDARSRFLQANGDIDGPDFAARVDGKRLLYKASGRRQRISDDGTEQLGDFSDAEDEVGLERRITRLKRQVEEAKRDYERQKAEGKDGSERPRDDGLDSLSRVLEGISIPAGFSAVPEKAEPAPPDIEKTLASGDAGTGDVPPSSRATYTVTYAPTYQQTHALAKAADFDRRLLMVEQALGISSSSLVEKASRDGLPPRAILPTLDTMEKQISTLSQASTANLDAISRRVRALASEQDKFNEAREKAKTLVGEDLGPKTLLPITTGDNDENNGNDAGHDEAKIKALYGILPTIESLTPVLPPLLDRLRSLRAIHADAATASQTLDQLETQQAEMAGELRQWREGIEKMEGAIRNGDAAVRENVGVMEGWVKGLEERMAKLR